MNTNKHTVSFWIFVPLFLVVLYAIGLLFEPAHIAVQLSYVAVAALTLVVWGLLTMLLIWGWFRLIFHMSVKDIIDDLRRFEHPSGAENLARSFMLGGLILLAGQLVGWSSAGNISLFFYSLLTKGAIALAAAIIATIVGAAFFKVHSIEEFKKFFDDAGNNQIVFIIMTLINVAAFVVMNIKI